MLHCSFYVFCKPTGTEVCNDPTRKVITVLLDNRCYPNKTGNLGPNIQHARRSFNNAVLAAVSAKEAADTQLDLDAFQ